MPRPSRPANAMFIAVCNILIGLSCLCCSGLGIAITLGAQAKAKPAAPPAGAPNLKPDAPAPPADPMDELFEETEEDKFLHKEVKHLETFQLLSTIASLIVALLLIIAAIGLFALKPWGRLFCFISAGLMLLITLGDIVNLVAFVYPARQKFEQQNPPNVPRRPEDGFGATNETIMGTCILATIGIAYPLLAMAVMMTSNVRHAYSGDHRDEEEQRYDRYQNEDDFDDRARRRRDDDFDDRRRGDDWER